MGLFSDFFRFVASVMLGKQDASRTFFEPLIMAERYMRWGVQRQDMRDFRRALEYLGNVRDEEAPKPDLILRKYLCLVDIAEGAIQLLIAQFDQAKARLLQSRQEKVAEAQNLRAHIDLARKRIAELKNEGSLIKAKEEERRTEENSMRLQALEQNLNNMPEEAELRQHFARLKAEAETQLQEVERAMIVVQARTDIAANALGDFREQVTKRTEKLRADITSLDPAVASAQSATDSPPQASASPSPAPPTSPAP